MVELYARNWRVALGDLLCSARRDLLITSPFVKTTEAKWVCEKVASRASTLRLQILTDVRSENVLNGSLDMEALLILARATPQSTVLNLPRLHAKVYVFDEEIAVVSSANLTAAGLDSNYEYGVGIREPTMVQRIRRDLEEYARVGNALAPAVLADLAKLGHDLSGEYQELQRSTSTNLRRGFAQRLRSANREFLKAQVGSRSANSLFSEAIMYLLSKGTLPTRALHPAVQRLLPDLCDDAIELIINGERFGKRWKHGVRNAQQFLKRKGVIDFDGRCWFLVDRQGF